MRTSATSNQKEQPILITEKEAARLLGVSDRTIWQLRKDGRLRGVKIGAAVRYARSELDRFISEQMSQNSAPATSINEDSPE